MNLSISILGRLEFEIRNYMYLRGSLLVSLVADSDWTGSASGGGGGGPSSTTEVEVEEEEQ